MQFPFLGFGPIFQLAKELAGIRFHQRTQAMICSKSTFLQAFDLDKVSTSRCESIFFTMTTDDGVIRLMVQNSQRPTTMGSF